MPNYRLDSYLRSHRKKSGLTQREVAFLLGAGRTGAQVSRHEKHRRAPRLREVFGYETIYGVPAGELFAGIRDREARKIKGRLLALRQRLEVPQKRGIEVRQAAKKLAWLKERHQL
jgi:transcriptional regulator with XRE-family HTH domain